MNYHLSDEIESDGEAKHNHSLVRRVFDKYRPDGQPKGFQEILFKSEEKRDARPFPQGAGMSPTLSPSRHLAKGSNIEKWQTNHIGKDSLSEISKRSYKSQLHTPEKVIEANQKKILELQKYYEEEKELNEFEKKLLRDEKDRYLKKITKLEMELQSISRTNYQLKSKANEEKEESLCHSPTPYVIVTRPNDLSKIRTKNTPQLFNLKQPQIPSRESFDSSNSYVLKELIDQLRPAPFDTFQQTHNSVLSHSMNDSRVLARMDSTQCTRNKVAFFKQSLILLRHDTLQLAFKRSTVSPTCQRIIFFVHNKTPRPEEVSLTYHIQDEYYRLSVKEKLQRVEGQAQGREVVEVALVGRDLNSIPDMEIRVGSMAYDLWMPVCFLEIGKMERMYDGGEEEEMEVVPDRQFKSYQSAERVLPLSRISHQGWMKGKSPFGEYSIKLRWQNKSLIITTTNKWIEFIAFIMHFYK